MPESETGPLPTYGRLRTFLARNARTLGVLVPLHLVAFFALYLACAHRGSAILVGHTGLEPVTSTV